MKWEYNENLPIYTQLVDQMKRAIVSGELTPGERLPSVRDIAIEAGVNPNTMQRAFQELERAGLVYTLRSSGRYITEDTAVIDSIRETLAQESIRSFLAGMKQLGFSHEAAMDALKNYEAEDSKA